MKVAVIGTGFVGVVTAAVLASFGNEVVGLDIDEKKVAKLRQSKVPFFEPGLEELLQSQQKNSNLTFTTDYATAIPGSQVVMVAVGTPSQESGQVDLSYVYAACEQMAPFLDKNTVVVIKSTVPPGTLKGVHERIAAKAKNVFFTASVPEFLKEGTAVNDTLHPDRIVIGVHEAAAFETLNTLHTPFNAPIVQVAPESAQMGKYAANSYLALRIGFINQIADLCEQNGADVQDVIKVIGLDKRIGSHYWYPGFGYGGSCFPKDVKEIAYYSKEIGEGDNLFVKLNEINEARIPKLLERFGKNLAGWHGKKVAVLGLSFKPNTDDMREAPSTKVIPWLLEKGATVNAFDPKALEVAPHYFPKNDNLKYFTSIEEAGSSVDVVMVLIEWKEIVSFDFSKIKSNSKQWIIDARNQLDAQKIRKWGFEYLGIGQQILSEKGAQ